METLDRDQDTMAPDLAADRGAGLLAELERCLRRQTEAAQRGEAGETASHAERAMVLLQALCQAAEAVPGALSRAALQRFRDLAAYNQLLLRFAFTRWAAARLDRARGRRAMAYTARGRVLDRASAFGGLAGAPRGVL